MKPSVDVIVILDDWDSGEEFPFCSSSFAGSSLVPNSSSVSDNDVTKQAGILVFGFSSICGRWLMKAPRFATSSNFLSPL